MDGFVQPVAPGAIGTRRCSFSQVNRSGGAYRKRSQKIAKAADIALPLAACSLFWRRGSIQRRQKASPRRGPSKLGTDRKDRKGRRYRPAAGPRSVLAPAGAVVSSPGRPQGVLGNRASNSRAPAGAVVAQKGGGFRRWLRFLASFGLIVQRRQKTSAPFSTGKRAVSLRLSAPRVPQGSPARTAGRNRQALRPKNAP